MVTIDHSLAVSYVPTHYRVSTIAQCYKKILQIEGKGAYWNGVRQDRNTDTHIIPYLVIPSLYQKPGSLGTEHLVHQSGPVVQKYPVT